MKRLLILLILSAAYAGAAFCQGPQNVKGTYGAGPPQSTNCPGDIGTQYVDISANQAYTITSISRTGTSTTCIWTVGGGGIHSIPFSIGTPGGSAISTGPIAYITVPFACTIQSWSIQVDAGTATVQFWKIAAGTAIPTVTNTISTSGVSIATGTVIQSTTLTDFTTTAIAKNDILAVNVGTVSGVGYINVQLNCQ